MVSGVGLSPCWSLGKGKECRSSSLMGSTICFSNGCGGSFGCSLRYSAMSLPVSVAAQKKAGLDFHPIWSAAGTTIIVGSSLGASGVLGRT